MTSLAFFNLQGMEIVILAIIGLLIFGKRLPEVGRNLGKGIVEFKKGLTGVEDELGKAGTPPPPRQRIANDDTVAMDDTREQQADAEKRKHQA